MARSVTVKLEGDVLERAERMCEIYNVSLPKLIKDTIENFLPYSDVPKEFINETGLLNILKREIPIRAILPFTSSMLGFNMVSDFEIDLNGRKVFINPYPEHSMLCAIKIIERLFQAIQTNTYLLGDE